MANKSGFKNFLLAKGEKYALYIGVGTFALFVLWGVMSAVGADDPKVKAKELKDQSDRINAAMNNQNTDLPPLSSALSNGASGNDFKIIPLEQFHLASALYEAVEWPSMRRENPRILAPTEGQIDYVQGSVKVFDRKFADDGSLKAMGVLIAPFVAKDQADRDKLEKLKEMYGKDIKKVKPKGRPGMGGLPFDPKLNPPMGDPKMPVGGDVRGGDTQVAYKTPEEAAKLNLLPAIVVRPLRMNVVQLSFPLKEQLEEIRRALRLRTISEAIQESGPDSVLPGGPLGPGGPAMRPPVAPPALIGKGDGQAIPGASQFAAGIAPVFEGLDVMRRVTPPGGSPGNWETLDHEGHFWDEFVRYDAPYLQETGWMPYFLRPEQRLSSPLPVMADGLDPNYPPPTRLSSIYANHEELRKKAIAPADKLAARFQKGSNNPYAPTDSSMAAFAPGYGNPEISRAPMFMPGLSPRPVRGSDQPVDPSKPIDPNKIDVENLLLRFVDTHMLQPGYSYEYKVRVRVRNPNYEKENVARNTDAKVKDIEGQWFEIPQKLTVPVESYLYAGDASSFEKSVTDLAKDTDSKVLPLLQELRELGDGKRAVIQFQQWFQSILVPGGGQEQLGSWVVVDVPVAPGEYIGRRTYLQLPLWSAGVGNFTFRTLPDDLKKALGWSATRPENMPRGYFVHDFRTRHLLVDFTGGKSKQSIGRQQVVDEAASELLILRDDGKIEVLSEAADTENKGRRERLDIWTKWIKEVKDRKDPFLGDKPLGPGGRTNPGGRTPGG